MGYCAKLAFLGRIFAAHGLPKDDTFAAVLFESASVCRRGAVLYPHVGELTVSFNGGKDAWVDAWRDGAGPARGWQW